MEKCADCKNDNSIRFLLSTDTSIDSTYYCESCAIARIIDILRHNSRVMILTNPAMVYLVVQTA